MKKITKIVFILLLLVFIFAIIFIVKRVQKSSFIVKPSDHALVIKDGVVNDIVKPGLHLSISGLDTVVFFPTQRVFRFKKNINPKQKIVFPDSIKTIEIPWFISDPKKFYETFGVFDEILVNDKIELEFNSEMNFFDLEKNTSINYLNQIGILNKKLKIKFNLNGVKIYQ
ncbi:MAG: hypothetical protein K8R79_04590, partial [Calditrichales bacterium]|nr:hypothetical protein [Calditrichales bacterium]